MKNKTTTYKWAYLPFVFSSAAILATQAHAGPTTSQSYQNPEAARQVNSINHEYVGGNHNIGFGVDDEGNVDVEINGTLSQSDSHRTGAGIWAGYDLLGDDQGLLGRGGHVNHAWVSKDGAGNARHVNKVFAAYDRNEAGHEKATVGYGQENQNLFWDARVSKGLSDNINTNSQGVFDRAYEWGVGATVGKHLPGANARIRAGIDHEWSDKVGAGEKDARNTTLSAGIEKFFQGTGHSVSLDVSGSKREGGYGNNDDSDVNGRIGYKYDFGGSSIYQPDRRYRRVRVEVPGTAIAPRYEQRQQYKKVPTYKTVPVYANKTVRTPTKQLVKSTMELEGQTFFKLNSSKLIPSAQTRLKQIAAQIRKSGYKGSIRITGNTCGLGDARYDQILSEKRANEVKKFLIANGFNPNHLIARGLGKGHPKYPRTPDQDFKNRRVDIEYVSQQQAQKTVYKTETKRVQTGTRQVATGFKNVPAGMKNVLISNGQPGAPRVIWRTEAIASSPAWVNRALRNTIRHNRNVNTYATTYTEGGPAVKNDVATTTAGSSVTIPVLDNDTSNSGSGQLTLTGVGTPSNGTAQIVNGQIVYTPNAGFVGTDSFTYTVTDSNGATATATTTVNVTGTRPVAVNDSATTSVDTPVTLPVLNNDSSNSGSNQLTLTSVGTPSNGTAQIVNGQIVYTPNAGFVGTDSFTYTVTDSNGVTATATATVTVGDDRPVAVDDLANTSAGQPVTISVVGNDTSNSGSGQLTVTSVGNPSNGTAQIVNGQIVYTPNVGFTGTDTFTYTITDSNGDTATANVTVNVGAGGGVNAGNDTSSTQVGQAVTINVLNNDDSDATLTGVLTQPGNGTAQIVNGQIVYTPNAGFTGTDSFTYQVRDPEGNLAVATVFVTVEDSNDVDPEAVDDTQNTGFNQSTTIAVLNNDTSNSGSGQLTLTSVGNPSNGTATIVNGEIVYTPNTGFFGTDTFTYTVTDSNGETDTATVTVNVAEPNKPVAQNDSANTAEGTPVTLPVLGNDTSNSGSGQLTITSVGNPSNGTAQIVNGQIVYTPNAGYTGTDSFTYTITDSNGQTATATATVNVTADPAPKAVNDSANTTEGTPVTLPVLGNDTSNSGSGQLTITSVGNPSNGTAQIVNGQVVYTPNAGFTGTDSFTYTITDSNGKTATATATVVVQAGNGKPKANDDAASTMCEAITIAVLDNDVDVDGDALSLISIDAGSLMFGSIQQSGNAIIYQPSNTCGKGNTGIDKFSYTISDGHGNTDTGNVMVTVKGNATTPSNVDANADDALISEGEIATLNVLTNDSGKGLRIIHVDQPANGTVTFTNSKITYTPNAGFTGSEMFYYDIVDENGHNDSALIIVDVVKGCSTGTKCN